MAKIQIMRDGQLVQESKLVKERMALGRHPGNDIVLDHRAVSARHCVFTSILNDVFLEDLDSTNGTFVNGQRILKHMLADGDQITVAKFQCRFVAGPRAGSAPPPLGQILVKTGNNAGKNLPLEKPLTTLGRPGVMVVVVSRTPTGYAVAHIDGDTAPLLNGQPLVRQAPRPLQPGDVLDLAGTQMEFQLAAA